MGRRAGGAAAGGKGAAGGCAAPRVSPRAQALAPGPLVCVGGQVFLSSGPPCPLLEDPQRIHPTPDSQTRPGVTWGQLHMVLTCHRIPGWYGERCVSRENRPRAGSAADPVGTSRDHTGRTSIPQVVLEESHKKGLLGRGNSAISQGLEGVAPDGKAPAELRAQSPVKTQTAGRSLRTPGLRAAVGLSVHSGLRRETGGSCVRLGEASPHLAGGARRRGLPGWSVLPCQLTDGL